MASYAERTVVARLRHRRLPRQAAHHRQQQQGLTPPHRSHILCSKQSRRASGPGRAGQEFTAVPGLSAGHRNTADKLPELRLNLKEVIPVHEVQCAHIYDRKALTLTSPKAHETRRRPAGSPRGFALKLADPGVRALGAWEKFAGISTALPMSVIGHCMQS